MPDAAAAAPSLHGFEMVEVGAPLRPATRTAAILADDEVLVEVAGCGVCHTDLGFLDNGVRTRHPLPLILGHEISGHVRAAGADFADLVGKGVVVPAVIPCGQCEDCRAGQPMICKRQVMPGNDRDGGFASHVVVPGRGICVVPGAEGSADLPLGPAGLTLRHLAVIADAVSTPFQALTRAGVSKGDVVVVIGLGGVGGYAAQLARAMGARVVGLDVDPHKLGHAPELGVDLALDPRSQPARELRKSILAWAKQQGLPTTRWTIAECSGSAPGQQLAFDLLVHGATLCVVGFTMDTVQVRLSNLMAFDARALGNWGCAPALYPEIVQLVLDGAIDVVSQTELRPLSDINSSLDEVRAHQVQRRLVMVP